MKTWQVLGLGVGVELVAGLELAVGLELVTSSASATSPSAGAAVSAVLVAAAVWTVAMEVTLTVLADVMRSVVSAERAALRSLRSNSNLTIKPVDKGAAVVVWRTDLYIAEARRQLSDTSSY
eukprot:g19360.t1